MEMIRPPMTCWLLVAFAWGAIEGAAAEHDSAELQDRQYYRVVDIASADTRQHSRDTDWHPGHGIPLEVSGLAVLDEDRVAVAIRKGEIWILDHVYGNPADITYHRFASGLDEPLGLLRDGDDLLTVQRTELTRLRDLDGDRVADAYLTEAKGWSVTGNYHGYAYGPVRDGRGRLWITLNLDLGKGDNSLPWHGWGLTVSSDGRLQPMCAGMRSPCGLGVNAAGDPFFTDQQGEWIPANSLHHLVEGAFYGNPAGLEPAWRDASLLGDIPRDIAEQLNGRPYPEALRILPALRPPAVWFPYRKMGQSRTDVVCDTTGGKFGPFAGQLFVGEFTQSRVGRVFLEKVNGHYQGACFPFVRGFPAAVMRLAFGRDGSLLVGMTNRGWTSTGGGSYGLQRLVWTGRTPFAIREMRARADGFELVFTEPVDRAGAARIGHYRMASYTYPLHSRYGGDEIDAQDLHVSRAAVSADGLRVRLQVEPLRRFYVHELHCPEIRGASGQRLWHGRAYYTLNHLPAIR